MYTCIKKLNYCNFLKFQPNPMKHDLGNKAAMVIMGKDQAYKWNSL